MVSKNPIMPKNITDYLVDEGSYEEEEYLGQYPLLGHLSPLDRAWFYISWMLTGSLIDEKKEEHAETSIERDEDLLKVQSWIFSSFRQFFLSKALYAWTGDWPNDPLPATSPFLWLLQCCWVP